MSQNELKVNDLVRFKSGSEPKESSIMHPYREAIFRIGKMSNFVKDGCMIVNKECTYIYDDSTFHYGSCISIKEIEKV